MFSDYACKINCSIPVNNVFRYFVINYNGKESEKQYTHTHTHTHTHIYQNHFAVQKKLTQVCKSTVFQLKKCLAYVYTVVR